MRRAIWTLALLSLAGCDRTRETPPQADQAPPEPEIVAVDWLGGGTLFAARVMDRRGDFTRVEYADGDEEWVERDRLAPWPSLSGRQVQYYTGTRAVDVTVTETRQGLLHVQFANGRDTWISPDMLYRLEPAEATGPGGGGGGTGRPSTFAARAPADPASVREGATVLAYWISGGEIDTTRPWRARVASRSGDTVHLAYMDGSEADLPVSAVLRVFGGGAQPSVGQRYWLGGDSPVGTLIEQRAGLMKLQAGGSERWVEAPELLAPAPPVDPSRLTEGTHVTALWSGSSLYHGTVRSVSGENVTLAWHDGSEPSAVPLADVLEVWSAAE